MSLCHPERGAYSCGSCCGLFNLKLTQNEFVSLLLERTSEFKKTVDFTVRHTFPIYRKNRETIEDQIPKNEATTYNCPFLGYVNEENKKIGCMIHPVFTGDPKSQNFSFYGASICQAYDCKNKEGILSSYWEELFSEISNSSIEYSFFSADHIFCSAIERMFSEKEIPMAQMFGDYRNLLKYLFLLRLKSLEDKNLTSFEINYEPLSKEMSSERFICEELKIKEIDWRV